MIKECLVHFSRGGSKLGEQKMAEIIAIKTTMDMYIGSSSKAHAPLIIELCSFVASEWLTNRSYRPWLLRNLFGDIDYGIKQKYRDLLFLKPCGELFK
ncbi:hypothetical protein Gotur_026625 [Gossypium turneri]